MSTVNSNYPANPYGIPTYQGKEKHRRDTKVKVKRNGQIKLDAGKGDDVIRVSRMQDGRYMVTVNDADAHYFTPEEMSRLKLKGGKGNDTLLIDPSAQGLNLKQCGIENIMSLPQSSLPPQPGDMTNVDGQDGFFGNGFGYPDVWGYGYGPNGRGYDQMGIPGADQLYAYLQGMMAGYQHSSQLWGQWNGWTNTGPSGWFI